MSDRLPAEFLFLLQALRTFRRGARAEALVASGQGLDWTAIVAGIARHGVSWIATPLLAVPQLAPPEDAAALRKATADERIATLHRVREAARVGRALEAAGVRFLILKGAALSVQLYGEPARRPARDVDVLIEPGKAAAAEAALVALGYFRPDGETAAEGPEAMAKEVGYVHRDSRILVEVHTRLTDNAELLPWDFETLWSDHAVVRIGSTELPTLAPDRLPLYLCVHGAKHCWARLIWLEDLADALGSPTLIGRAMSDARALGLEPLLLHGLHLAHEWLGLPVPAELLALAKSRAQVRRLASIVAWFHRDRRWYESPARKSWRRFRQGSIQLRMFSYAMKSDGRYLRRQLAIDLDSPADRRRFRLPPGRHWRYLALRPVGWLLRRL